MLEQKNIKKEICDIAIVLPTLNEEVGIEQTLNSIKQTFDSKLRYKVIVVDGLSTDRTVDIAKSLGSTVILQRRKGTGDALQAGFRYAEIELDVPVIAMMDGDGTYDAKDIMKMFEVIKKGEADFVTGNRLLQMDQGAMTKTNKFGNKILSWFARKLLKIDIVDSQSGIRAFRSDLASLFYSVNTGFPWVTEMLVIANSYGIRMKEVPVLYHPRCGETNLTPFEDGLRIFSTIIRLMRDSRPLAFFGLLGSISIAAGLAIGIDVIIEWLQTGEITRIPRTILSALLMLIGAQTLSLGLISDLIKNKTFEKRIFYNK